MSNSVILRSMLRQPVQTAILVMIIVISTFMYVARAVEYLVVKECIASLGEYYRTIGYLSGMRGSIDDVTIGAGMVRSSEYVDFEDRRRGAEGILHGMQNADISSFNSRHYDFETEEITPLHVFRYTDAFFYGELTGITRNRSVVAEEPFALLSFRVDIVILGYPEHIVEGQTVYVRYYLSDAEIEEENRLIDEHGSTDLEILAITEVSGMTLGQRYLIRGETEFDLYRYGFTDGVGLPRIGREIQDELVMLPLNSRTHDWLRLNPDNAIWFIPVAADEGIDISSPEMEWLLTEITNVRHDQSAVHVRTSSDMTAIPYAQPEVDLMRLTDGRWLNREDHLNGNNVVMIHEQFARIRNISIGDTISISIPREQYLLLFETNLPPEMRGLTEFVYKSKPGGEIACDLELEIVGLFEYKSEYRYSGLVQTPFTVLNTLVYIPDSLFPDDIVMNTTEHQTTHIAIQGFEFLVDTDSVVGEWYSFVLRNPLEKNVFFYEINESRNSLGDTGTTAIFRVNFIETDIDEFTASTDKMLLSSTITIILFSGVLLIVLALVAFAYLRLRRSDLAVMRILGRPKTECRLELLATLLVFSIPAIIVGGISGWFFSFSTAANILNPNEDYVTSFFPGIKTDISFAWVFILIFIPLLMHLIIASAGSRHSAEKSILEIRKP